MSKPSRFALRFAAPFAITLSMALSLAACGGGDDNPPAATSKLQTLQGQDPIVIAHRGASGYFPEETLEAYALAIAMGADVIASA